MAKKSELEFSYQQYLSYCSRSQSAAVTHDYPDAVTIAVESLPLAWDAVAYQRRFQQIEQPELPTVLAIVRYAPALFDWSRLDALETWYGSAKRNDKQIYASLRSEIDAARRAMALAARLWDEADGGTPGLLAGDEMATAKAIHDLWIGMGVIALRNSRGIPIPRHVTRPKGEVMGKCSSCGGTRQAGLDVLLANPVCEFCNKSTGFVLTCRVF